MFLLGKERIEFFKTIGRIWSIYDFHFWIWFITIWFHQIQAWEKNFCQADILDQTRLPDIITFQYCYIFQQLSYSSTLCMYSLGFFFLSSPRTFVGDYFLVLVHKFELFRHPMFHKLKYILLLLNQYTLIERMWSERQSWDYAVNFDTNHLNSR